ncbi:DcaP family trimeric outer membrane transporter [Pseudoalteromonas sp. T1lg22]|uniref:DcaP family trimeric outer membrane transporter n=2 Tax=unclassified Pseudoalteromonas TaxID=194690 RepID=UPI000CF65F4D|nr:DcaP family trimeric outer membrane transporter [Pseudoalteromonas sp. T1lg22]
MAPLNPAQETQLSPHSRAAGKASTKVGGKALGLALAALLLTPAVQGATVEERLAALERRIVELEQQLKRKDAEIEQQLKLKDAEIAAIKRPLATVKTQTEQPQSKLNGRLYQEYERPSYRFKTPPKSIFLSDSDTTLQIGGQIWLDAIYNDGDMANRGAFQTSSILFDEDASDDKTLLNAGQSKLSFRSHTPTEHGDMTTRFEFDMFDGDGNADFNLTHLWGELGNWGAGQTFSGFMDINSFPNILDYWGPSAMVFARHPQIRYRRSLGNGSFWALGIERSDADLALPVNIDPESLNYSEQNDWPDASASYTYQFDQGYIKTALLLRYLGYKTNLQEDKVWGWGINVTGTYDVNYSHSLKFQIANGKGIGRYLNDPCCHYYADITGGSDAGLDGNGELTAIGATAGFIYLDKQWNDNYTSSIGISYVDIDNIITQHPLSFNNSLYSTVNLIYNPTTMSRLGIELQYGELENYRGDKGDNLRLQTSFGFKY